MMKPNQVPYGWEMTASMTPKKCPVCDGKGIVPNGFYNFNINYTAISTSPEKCRTCDGKGILWHNELYDRT